MSYLGSFKIDDYVPIPAACHRFTTGGQYAPTVLTYSIYEEGSATGLDEDIDMTPATPFDSIVGFYYVRRQLTAAAGFEVGKTYMVLIKATVDSVTAIEWHTFQVEAALPTKAEMDAAFAAVATAAEMAALILANPTYPLATDSNGNVTLKSGTHTGAVIPTVTTLTTWNAIALKKNVESAPFVFPMRDSTTHNPVTGKTVTATRSIDGGAFAPCANAVAEIATASKRYKITFANTDLAGDSIHFVFTATDCDDLDIWVRTQS